MVQAVPWAVIIQGYIIGNNQCHCFSSLKDQMSNPAHHPNLLNYSLARCRIFRKLHQNVFIIFIFFQITTNAGCQTMFSLGVGKMCNIWVK